MRESIIRALKWLILAFSLIMFFYQMQIAVNKFLTPPVVDSTDLLNIADIEPPLITVCPLNQLGTANLMKMGYRISTELLLGLQSNNNMTAWGAQHNMTFDEMIEEFVNLDKDYPILEFRNEPLWKVNYEKRYYPKYGRCVDFSNYTTTGNLELVIYIDKSKNNLFYQLPTQAEVFLTDKKLRTRNTVHKPSHWGSSIIIKTNKIHNYLVKVEQLSSFDPRNPNNCKEYINDEFETCVDEELQDLWKPMIGCNPPWLSPQDQCNALLNTTDVDDFVYTKRYHTVNNIEEMKNYAAKERCTKACLVTRLNIYKNGVKTGFGPSILNLVFDDIVVKKTKILAYNFSEFLIDIGSSLGLWFGLSVFGITDLGIMVLQWAEKIRGRALKYLD